MRTSPSRGPKQRPPLAIADPAATARTGEPARLAVLPLPPELPRVPPCPRVLQLTDGDCVSYGLADGTGRSRASDQEMRSCLNRVHATAALFDPHARIRCAVSAETASHHLDVLTAARNNFFTIRGGLDGAAGALLEELTDLIDTRLMATRPRRKRPARHADLVILVARDEIYTPPVMQLRLLGIPTWLLVPGRLTAASLRSAACAISCLGPAACPEPNATGKDRAAL
jgi:hypothetical protein